MQTQPSIAHCRLIRGQQQEPGGCHNPRGDLRGIVKGDHWIVRFILIVNETMFIPFPVLCHVYITMDSYLSMRAHPGVVAQELVQAVAERMDVPQGDLVLVAVTYPGGKNHTK